MFAPPRYRRSRPAGSSIPACHAISRHGWSANAGDPRSTSWLTAQDGLAAEDAAPYSPKSSDPQPLDPQAPDTGASSAPGSTAGDTALPDLAPVHAALDQIAGSLRELVDAVPGQEAAAHLSVDDLDPCLTQLKRVEGAVAAVRARVVALASYAKAHDASGMASPDMYLRDRLGISSREARKQRDLARTLDAMDGARDALADGRLGTEQASAIGRAVRNGHLGDAQEVEEQLLDTATTSSPEQLNEAIRRAEQHANADALRRGENRAYERRRASCTKQEDGSWLLNALLDPIAGEQVAIAIRAFTKPDPAQTPIDRRRRPEQRTADGLAALAEAALTAGAPKSGGHRPQVSVIVPFDAWEHHRKASSGQDGDRAATSCTADCGGGSVDGGGPASILLPELGSGTTISPEAAQRIMCDAKITRVVMGARSQVLDVGRATSDWTAGQRAAAAVRDRGCRGPGCDRPTAWCQLHHIWWWSKGGPTDLDNGIQLCHQHHRLVHEGGWGLRFDPATARATFIDPTGREYSTLPRGSPG